MEDNRYRLNIPASVVEKYPRTCNFLNTDIYKKGELFCSLVEEFFTEIGSDGNITDANELKVMVKIAKSRRGIAPVSEGVSSTVKQKRIVNKPKEPIPCKAGKEEIKQPEPTSIVQEEVKAPVQTSNEVFGTISDAELRKSEEVKQNAMKSMHMFDDEED